MTLHIIEVEVIHAAVHKAAGLGNILELDGHLGNGVGAAKVHGKHVVDEQVHVIIAGEGEVLVRILTVHELGMTFKGKVVVVPAVKLGIRVVAADIKGFAAGDAVAIVGDGVKVVIVGGHAVAPAGNLAGRIDLLGVVDKTVGAVVCGFGIGGAELVANLACSVGGLDELQLMVGVIERFAVTSVGGEGAVQQEVGGFIIGIAIRRVNEGAAVEAALCIAVGAGAAVDVLTQHGGKILIAELCQLFALHEVVVIGAVRILFGHGKGLFKHPCKVVHHVLLVDEVLARSGDGRLHKTHPGTAAVQLLPGAVFKGHIKVLCARHVVILGPHERPVGTAARNIHAGDFAIAVFAAGTGLDGAEVAVHESIHIAVRVHGVGGLGIVHGGTVRHQQAVEHVVAHVVGVAHFGCAVLLQGVVGRGFGSRFKERNVADVDIVA